MARRDGAHRAVDAAARGVVRGGRRRRADRGGGPRPALRAHAQRLGQGATDASEKQMRGLRGLTRTPRASSYALSIPFLWRILSACLPARPPWLSGPVSPRSRRRRTTASTPRPSAARTGTSRTGPGSATARSRCRSAPPLVHFRPESLTYSAPLFMKRPCDRTLGDMRPFSV